MLRTPVSNRTATKARTPVRRKARRRTVPAPTEPRRPLELDTIASHWQQALDADERALAAAGHTLSGAELARRHSELVEERRQAAVALTRLAETARVHPLPWLAPTAITPRMLGLPDTITACLFDLDGVLTDSGVLHASAWAAAFDGFLQRISERNDWHFIPFDRGADYAAYIDGRPRLEGVRTFLQSRGIRLPEGRPDDPATAETAYGLARHKSEALARRLHRRGVAAVPGARRYLEAAGHSALKRGIVSASANTLPMLELAGLATLVESRADAELIRADNLRSRPAPDLLLAACRRLEVDPASAATFTPTPAGVAAGLAAGMLVIGVGEDERAETLEGFGADRVVPSLEGMLDRRLR